MNRTFSSSDFSDSEDITFVKLEHEKILQNSNIYKQDEQTNNKCIKHPNKKVLIQLTQAKFYVQQNSSELFCSKCALNLALQGMKIEETQEIQLEQQRQNKISKFTENLNLALKNCDQKALDLASLISNLKVQFEEQQQNCCKFFDSATNTIGQLKQTYLSKFSNDFLDQKENVQRNIDNVKLLAIQLKQFREDIQINHENIVKKMEMKPFQEIMAKYEKKVDETLAQLTKFNIQPSLKLIQFEHGQILAFMNKMCYNLLLKHDCIDCPQQKVNLQSEQKLFEMLESEEIYQTTFSNPIKEHSYIFSPIKTELKQEPINQNTIRSQQNTPENQQQKLYIQKTHFSITPNEKDLPPQYSQRGGEISAKKVLQKQLNDKFAFQISEKQKTTTEYERGSENSRSQWNNNISCLQLQKFMKDVERGSLENRELSPKHQMISKCTQKLKRETKHITQKSQQLFVNNQGLKQQFDSVPNLKALASQSSENQLRFQSSKQSQDLLKRPKSKQPKQQSTDQIEGRRQFIMAGQLQQYQSQQVSNEETLKDRILKELCSHPGGESVYSQVLKSNQKQRNVKILQKENCEWSSTRNKSNGYNTNKKQ